MIKSADICEQIGGRNRAEYTAPAWFLLQSIVRLFIVIARMHRFYSVSCTQSDSIRQHVVLSTLSQSIYSQHTIPVSSYIDKQVMFTWHCHNIRNFSVLARVHTPLAHFFLYILRAEILIARCDSIM